MRRIVLYGLIKSPAKDRSSKRDDMVMLFIHKRQNPACNIDASRTTKKPTITYNRSEAMTEKGIMNLNGNDLSPPVARLNSAVNVSL